MARKSQTLYNALDLLRASFELHLAYGYVVDISPFDAKMILDHFAVPTRTYEELRPHAMPVQGNSNGPPLIAGTDVPHPGQAIDIVVQPKQPWSVE